MCVYVCVHRTVAVVLDAEKMAEKIRLRVGIIETPCTFIWPNGDEVYVDQ